MNLTKSSLMLDAMGTGGRPGPAISRYRDGPGSHRLERFDAHEPEHGPQGGAGGGDGGDPARPSGCVGEDRHLLVELVERLGHLVGEGRDGVDVTAAGGVVDRSR